MDLRRTLRVGPESAAFRRLFVVVSEAHAAAIGEVKRGALPIDIDGAARRVLLVVVFTIEPGGYVSGTSGVRIEDDVLVVEGGGEVLTDGI